MPATKTKKARQPRPKRMKQQHLPTMEPPCVPKIDHLADEFFEARLEKRELAETEKTKGDLLYAAMRQEGLTRYEYAGGVVELEDKCKVKVTKPKGGGEEKRDPFSENGHE